MCHFNATSPHTTCDRKYKCLLSPANAQNDQRTPLHEAAFNGDAATVEALIVAGGPELIDIKDWVGCTMK